MTSTNVLIERNIMVSMRDGVRLATDLYRPIRAEPVPVLLHRIPYGKQVVPLVHTLLLDPITAAERGFAVVVQDTRGCGASEGEFDPLFQERADGHDTIDWIASSPWCDGNIGIYGSSYMGVTALQAVVDAPETLKACVAYLTGSNYHDTWCYSGGAFELGFQLRWSMGDANVRRNRMDARHDFDPAAVAAVLAEFAADPLAFFATSFDPLALPRACDAVVPYYARHLRHPDYDDYWAEIDLVAAADRISVPVMQVAGWYDGFLKSGVDLHQALVARSPAQVRDIHTLTIGPWDHTSYLGSQTLSSAGVRRFGPAAAGGQPGMQPAALAWFERFLRPTAAEPPEPPPRVRYFQIGPNRWADSAHWPPRGVAEQRWYLTSAGGAQAADGDGVLTLLAPEDQPYDSFIYDPADPVPTHGGRHLIYELPSGVQDQRVVEDRPDVLVYTSDALLGPVTIAGAVRVELHVSSSAPGTDFFAALVDVYPDGRAENVVEGIVRLEADAGENLTRGRLATIDLWYTAYTFPVGHQMRVHITSSSFPRFDRNRNLGPDGAADQAVAAVQYVHHDAEHPSALIMQCLGT